MQMEREDFIAECEDAYEELWGQIFGQFTFSKETAHLLNEHGFEVETISSSQSDDYIFCSLYPSNWLEKQIPEEEEEEVGDFALALGAAIDKKVGSPNYVGAKL